MTSVATSQIRPVAIVGANRVPFVRSNGKYADLSNTDLFSAALQGVVEKYGLEGQQLGCVAGGAILKHSRDFNLTRECVLNTDLDPATAAIDMQQACGTGLAAISHVADSIALGRIDSGIAGGSDTTSDAPIAIGDDMRKALVKLGAAKTMKQRVAALSSLKNLGGLVPEIPQNSEPRTGLSMGEHAAITARKMKITRQAQDELAVASHHNLAAAYERGFCDDLVSELNGVTRDDNLRADTSVEKLAALRPVFGRKDADRYGVEATMTAANSTPLTDGASAVLLSTDEWASERGLDVWAYLRDVEQAAVDFVPDDSGKTTAGLLMAPTYAVPRLLERNNLTLQDFDFYEIHEAFASQVLATLAAWESEEYCTEQLGLGSALGSIDRSKLNVAGSSLAAGHPFAATGARIVATAAKLLAEKGSGRALVSICAAGGQGVTAIIERP